MGAPELMVLAIVGLIVLGPERLPGLARDAARMLRSLREMATGARQQLREELGPEFADIDLANLNPRRAVQRAVFGDEFAEFGQYDPRRFNPSEVVRNTIFGDDETDPTDRPVSMTKPAGNGSTPRSNGKAPGTTPNTAGPVAQANGDRPRPRPRPKPGPGRGDGARFDDWT
ncbi:MAG TPA: Sec-independent protein translocase protein TatB [Jatrophihabitans sp.]|nr:Sec-independent protein translocase protein TatB [Jatrophihabitans sp.]